MVQCLDISSRLPHHTRVCTFHVIVEADDGAKFLHVDDVAMCDQSHTAHLIIDCPSDGGVEVREADQWRDEHCSRESSCE